MLMRALTILRHPHVRVLIVGDNEAGYGGEGAYVSSRENA